MILEIIIFEIYCQTLELRALKDPVCARAETRGSVERLIFKRAVKCDLFHPRRWEFLAVSVRLGRATPKALNPEAREKPIFIEGSNFCFSCQLFVSLLFIVLTKGSTLINNRKGG